MYKVHLTNLIVEIAWLAIGQDWIKEEWSFVIGRICHSSILSVMLLSGGFEDSLSGNQGMTLAPRRLHSTRDTTEMMTWQIRPITQLHSSLVLSCLIAKHKISTIRLQASGHGYLMNGNQIKGAHSIHYHHFLSV